MSDFLVKTVFKILGGGSMGFNQGRIDQRVAAARAKEIADASALTVSEREAAQLFKQEETEKANKFELKVNRINQGYAKINALQAQIYETSNIQEKAKMEKLLEEEKFYQAIALKGVEAEYGEDLEGIKQTWKRDERIDQNKFVKWQTEEEIKSREKIAREKNENALAVETLKDSINKTNNTQSYYIGGNPDVTLDPELEIFGTQKQIKDQENKKQSQKGINYIDFNISEKDTEAERVEKKYRAWVRQSKKIAPIMEGLLKEGRLDDFKKIMDDLNLDLFKHKKFLLAKKNVNIHTSSLEDQRAALDTGVIMNLLRQWDDEDENTITYKDVVHQYVKSMWYNNAILADPATDELFDGAIKSLNVNMVKKSEITLPENRSSDNHDLYYAVAKDLGVENVRLFRDRLDNSGVQQSVFNRRSSEKAEIMAAILFNHNDKLLELMEGVDGLDKNALSNLGIKSSKHYRNGYLSQAEQMAVEMVLKDEGGIYNSENITTVREALELLMPDYNEKNAKWNYTKFLGVTGIDPKNIRAKVTSGNQAISTIRAVIDLYEDNANMASGKVGLFTTKIFEMTLFRNEGSFLNVAANWLKSAGYSLTNQDEEDSMTNVLGKSLKDADILLKKARNGASSGNPDFSRLSKDEQVLLDTHTKEAYMALLAYQVAAAIQGGTGGRTISDQDVANIRKALGEQFFDYGKGAVARLTAFKAVLGKIVKVNEAIQEGLGSVRGLKAGQAISSIYLGAPLSAFRTQGWSTDAFMNKVFYDDPNYKKSQEKESGPESNDPAFSMDNVFSHPLYAITEDEKIRISKAGKVGDTYYNIGDLYTGPNDPAIIKLFTDKDMFSSKMLKDLNSYRDNVLETTSEGNR